VKTIIEKLNNVISGPRIILFPVIIWLLHQYITFQKLGVRTGSDTGRYFTGANEILNGGMPQGKSLSYIGYDLFVAFVTGLGGDSFAIVLFQMVLAFFALLALYSFANNVFNKRSAFFAACLYALYHELCYWNNYVLTESIYMSFIIFSLWWLTKIKQPWQWLVAGFLVLFTVSIRPHGVGFLAAFAAYIMLMISAEQYKIKIGLIVLAILFFPLLWMKVGTMASHENLVVHHYKQGTLIWGHPDSNLEVIQDDPDASRYNKTNHPIAAIAWFIVEQPDRFIKLASRKFYYFVSHTRPFYSNTHNLITMVFLYPSYIFMIFGLIAARANKPHIQALLFWILFMQTLIVVLTFADWDGRHLIPVTPVIFILAAAGFDYALKRYKAGLTE
jgi:4-amino-4-deoxy-L-arabinose transferase-like glycosyltransferase